MKFDGPLLNDRWRLGPRLGAGTQALTFLARDESAAKEHIVVVKQLRLGEASGSTWKKFDLFEREVRVLRSLDHPGIPRFVDSFDSEVGVFNLVMEKAPGASLRAIATKARFTDADLRDVLARVLTILEYLHNLNPPVIHRDIKPANLIRAADGQVSLVDFGGVRDVLRNQGGSTVVGTFGYMAPEQLHGQATPATDLYALGATIVALAGGVEPEDVPRRGLRMDLEKHLRGSDPALVELLLAMTKPDPEERPQSAAEVVAMIEERPARALATVALPGKVAPAPTPTRDLIAKPVDDIAEFIDELPRPLRIPMRILFFLIGAGGYVGLTVFRWAFMPLIFGLVGGFAKEHNKPKVASVRAKVGSAVDEGRDGFRALSSGVRRRRHALPAPKPPGDKR